MKNEYDFQEIVLQAKAARVSLYMTSLHVLSCSRGVTELPFL